MHADCHNNNGKESSTEHTVDRDQHRFDKSTFEAEVDRLVAVSVTVQVITRANSTRVTPAPNLHKDGEHDTHGDVGCEEYITAP